MNEFRATFREAARISTDGILVPASISLGDERDLLQIPKQREDGFPIQIECMDYGAYPFAGDWFGAPWDVTIWESEDFRQGIQEFVDSVLNDAVLEIHYSNEKPFKWVLHHNFEGGRIADARSTIFFNWFGHKVTREYRNGLDAT